MNINWQKKWKSKDEAKVHILRYVLETLKKKGARFLDKEDLKHEGLPLTMDFWGEYRLHYVMPEKKRETRFKKVPMRI